MKAFLYVALFLLMTASAPAQSDCPGELCRLIAQGDFADYPDEVKIFYQMSGLRFVWIQGGTATLRARQLVSVLENADEKGLDPADYDALGLASQLRRLDQNQGQPAEVDLARFDLDLTVSLMRYLSDLCFGKADPGLYRSKAEEPALSTLVQRVLVATEVETELRRLEPPFDGYRRTLRALQQYRTLDNRDDRTLLPPTAKPVEAGQLYPGVPRLVRLLEELGDLPADVALSADSTRYVPPLVEAIKGFQRRHGLDADGRIGKATLAQLNVPLSHRVRQIELTLERWRWVPREFPRSPIVLNLPEFELRAYNSSYRPELEMKIVAGKAQRRQTPQFAGELQFVIFRPYWNVPLDIQRTELVPEIERDRSYLGKHDYEAITPKGAIAARGAVSDEVLARLRSGKLLLRQRPGPSNSLGLVKFMFPNEHNVYLHDTPARSLFGKARRDFSHGCMRVERAEDLAVWVLRDEPGWPRERIVAAMNGTETIQVNLKQPIPVLIVYGTAVVLESGEVNFFDDIYGYDAALDKQLTSAVRGQRPRE